MPAKGLCTFDDTQALDRIQEGHQQRRVVNILGPVQGSQESRLAEAGTLPGVGSKSSLQLTRQHLGQRVAHDERVGQGNALGHQVHPGPLRIA